MPSSVPIAVAARVAARRTFSASIANLSLIVGSAALPPVIPRISTSKAQRTGDCVSFNKEVSLATSRRSASSGNSRIRNSEYTILPITLSEGSRIQPCRVWMSRRRSVAVAKRSRATAIRAEFKSAAPDIFCRIAARSPRSLVSCGDTGEAALRLARWGAAGVGVVSCPRRDGSRDRLPTASRKPTATTITVARSKPTHSRRFWILVLLIQ